MKALTTLAFVAAFTCAALPLSAKIERTVEKTFTVTGIGTLRLNTSGGAIRVSPGPDGVVTIVAKETIRADSDAEADKLLEDLELTFAQNGNDVQASAKYDRPVSGFFRWGGSPVVVEFIATVPAAYVTDLRTSGGSITVGDLNGRVETRTSGGGIRLGRIGNDVDAHTSGGSITLRSASGNVKLNTSGGRIEVGNVAGTADLSTSGGSIEIESVSNRVNAHTSGGSVRAGIAGKLNGDCELSTSGGSVSVTVDKAASFQLDASTSGGGVNVNGITMTLQNGHHSRNKLSGPVNGGGPLLKLRSSGGSIRVDAR
ncbi:DUF4097 family beta strand repeat-containing protein [Opitutus sp. ER46]|uniref:DUF4097 family beta strand repeat-containing protein n=1 Tax=Opitutus sp. ER46 TaxID=2161864 RepID=UPI000D3135B4|nr:DUF4097 family beta strand repeat-containing protein [Opitutus sp. ER46]PTX91761.1 hypothetical protein DB354_18040 [Opitutus sp. ER46]